MALHDVANTPQFIAIPWVGASRGKRRQSVFLVFQRSASIQYLPHRNVARLVWSVSCNTCNYVTHRSFGLEFDGGTRFFIRPKERSKYTCCVQFCLRIKTLAQSKVKVLLRYLVCLLVVYCFMTYIPFFVNTIFRIFRYLLDKKN